MSSQGGGKAKAKRSRQEKPYERRQTNGSLLGRLTSTVSSLLPGGWVPSWLLNPPPTSSESTSLAGSTSGPSTSSLHPPPATQRNQLNSHSALPHQPSSSQSRRHNQSSHRYQLHQPASSHVLGRVGGPSGGSTDSGSGTAPSLIQPLSQDSAEHLSLALADSMAQRRLQRQQLQEDHQLQLSSTERESPTDQLQPPTPSSTASAAKRARFQPAALNTSLQLDTSARSMDGSGALSRTFCGVSSSYYPGPTVYGGAANHRRLRVIPATSAAPYQARRPRTVGASLSVSSAAGDPASSTSNLSSSSRRILAALERMSTPVWDAQRQPRSEPPPVASVAASTSLLDAKFSGERRRGLYGALGARLGAQRRGVVPGPTDTPPVQRQNTPRAVQRQENRATRLAEEAAAASQRATDALHDMQQRRDQPANRLVKHVTFSSDTPSTAAAPAGGGGGKMRRAKELRHYRSSEPSDGVQHESALPDVSLSTPAPLRPLHFLHTSTPKSPEKPPVVDAASQPFEFSAPRASCVGPSSSAAASDQPAQFSFSKPRPARAPQHRAPTGASPALSDNQLSRLPSVGSTIDGAVITNSHTSANSGWGDKFRPAAGEWTCSACMVKNQQSNSKCVACQTPSGADNSSKGTVTTNSSSWGNKFLLVAGEWTCSTCMVKNQSASSKCVACQTSKSNDTGSTLNSSTSGSSWGNKFLPVAGEWTCSTCMVKNQSSSSKCVACETPGGAEKSSKGAVTANCSSWGGKFLPVAGEWTCSTCMVKNQSASSKCVACETPGGAENSSQGTVPANSSSWGNKFLPLAGEWTCSTCMVKNQSASSKCVACETPGGAENSSQGTVPANSSSWGNKFLPLAGEWTCSTCMVKNQSASSKCVACETPGGASVASALTQSSESQRATTADWECLTCLVRNRPAVSRCIACQSLRADRLAKTSSADSAACTPKFQFGVASDGAAGKFSFGFSAPTSSSPSGGASGTAAVPTGAGGYFGASACEPVAVNGPSAAAVAALKSASVGAPALFGASDKPNQRDESTTVVVNHSDVKADSQPQFVFGIPAAAKSSAAATTSESFVFAARPSAVIGKIYKPTPFVSKFVSSAAVSSAAVSSAPVSSAAVSSTPVSSAAVPAAPFVFGSGVSSAAAALVFGCPTPVSSAAVSAAPVLGSSVSSAPASSAPTSAVSTAVTSSSLLFSAPASSALGAGFSFGATAAPVVTTASAAAVSSAPLTFGAVSSSAAATTTTSSSAGLFSFGASTAAAPATTSSTPAAAVFAFGSSPAPASLPVSSSAAPPFSAFGAAANSTAVSNHVPSSSGFAFGANSSQQSVPAAGAFSFGAPAAGVAVPGAFSFGSKPPSDSAAAKPQSAVFAFGATPADPTPSTVMFGATSAVTASGVFGANPAAANAPAMFGAKPASATVPAMFGAKSATATVPAGLGVKPTVAAVPAVFGATPAASVTQPGVFAFGAAAAPSSNSDGFAFGAKSAAPSAGAFAFGAKPAALQPTAVAPSMFDAVPSGFQFGGAAAPTPFGQTAPVASGAFNFGGAAAPPAAAAGVFSFGGPPAATPTAALPATGAPGIFQFGTQPAGSAAGPFGATQPPSGNPFDATGAGGTRKIKTARRRIRK